MKIKFVTESHVYGDVVKSVDVASQRDLVQTRGRIDELAREFDKVGKRLSLIEKSLGKLEKSLSNVDVRLRDDCKSIFDDLVQKAFEPVFVAAGQLAKAKEIDDGHVKAKRTTDRGNASVKVSRKSPLKTAKTVAGKGK